MFFRLDVRLKKWTSALAIFTLLLPTSAPVVEASWWSDFVVPAQNEINDKIPKVRRKNLVAILVEDEIAGTLRSKIDRYASDVQTAINVEVMVVPVPRDASPITVFEGLQQLYFSGNKNDNLSQLVGVVLVGEVPVPVVDKNGARWPTLWPYTDFENVSYQWDLSRGQFVWQGGDDQPEIWHGWIRSDATSASGRATEIEQYFDRNHRVHAGEETYARKIFFTDLVRQRVGLSDGAKKSYQNWIDFAEDVAYLRYTKYFGKNLFDSSGMNEIIPPELQPEEMQDFDTSVMFDEAPDVQVKNMIDAQVKQYFEANENLLSRWNDRTNATGRWDATSADTTISLVSHKDAEAVKLLRSFNDALEDALFGVVESAGTAAEISLMDGGAIQKKMCISGVPPVVTTTYKFFPDEPSSCPVPCTCDYFYFPERWNGVPIDEDFEVKKDCSLLRGSIADVEHPLAQRVEANRVFSYDPEILNQESGDVCTDESYEFCCGQIGDDGVQTEQCRAENVQSLDVEFTNDGEEGYGFRNELQPIFNIRATTEITADDLGYDEIGARGCEDIIWEKYPDRYPWASSLGDISSALPPKKSSLVEHVEPTVETIRQQVSEMITKSLPVDDPRGFSLYDSELEFHRIGYPNVFDLRGVGTDLPEKERKLFLQETLESNLAAKISEVQALPNGTIPDTTFDSVLAGFDLNQILDAVVWLDLPLEEKNVQMLVGALMDTPDARTELLDPEHNGYEVIAITGQESMLLPRGGVDVAFERGTELPNNTVQDAIRTEKSARWTDNSERRFSDVDFEREVLGDGDGGNSEKRLPSCEGQNILVWPLCLAQWLTALPEAFSQFTQVVAQFSDDLENAESEESVEDVRVHAGFADPAIVDVVTEMKLEPEKLELRASDSMPQKVRVTLVCPSGGAAQSVFENVTVSGSGDVAKFLKIVPGTTRKTTEGEVDFVLVPQRVREDAEFDLTFSGAGVSATLPVKICATELDVWSDRAQLPVRDVAGASIEATVLDAAGKIDHRLDGQGVNFLSDWGTFDGGKTGFVEDGVVTVRFFPGTVAGLAEIGVRSSDDGVAPAKTFVRLLPGKPDHLIFTGPDALVVGGDPVSVHAELADRWDNVIDDPTLQLVWTEQGVTTSESSGAGMLVAISEKTDEPAIKISSGLIKKVVHKKFEPVVDPTFRVTTSLDTLEAGSADVANVRLEALKPDGSPLVGRYSVQLVRDVAGIGEWPEKVELIDGVVNFDVRPGTLAGTVVTEVQAPGFVSEPFTITVEPSDPYRILLKTDETTISVRDAGEISVAVSVVDQFGNLTPEDAVTVGVRVDPPETFSGAEKDELIDDLGVYESGSEGAAFLERKVAEASETEGTPLLVPNPATLSLVGGRGDLTLESLGIGGHAYVLAESSGLVPAVLEIELTNVLAVSDLKFLNPKSLLTLILGMDGGNLTRPAIGTRFLHDGETQAVGTMLVSPTAHRQVGVLTAAGEVGELEAAITPSQFFEITLGGENPVARVRANFGTEVPIFWNETRDRGEGVYLRSWSDDVQWQNGVLSQGSEKLLKITSAGGVQVQRSDVEIVPRGKSIWDWEILKKEKLVARLRVLPPERFGVVGEWSVTPGVQVRVLDENVSAEMAPVGVSTGERLGVLFSSVSDTETSDRMLGSGGVSVEDALEKSNVGWTEDWKPVTLFAAGNTIGDSVRFYSSDAFVLLGDPTVRVPTENKKNSLGITADIGRPMWVSPLGGIDQVHAGDLNGDGRAEIFPRVGTKMYVLFHDAQQRDNFRDTGPLLRFADGVKMTAVLPNRNGDLGAILQINSAGELVWHQNRWGVLERRTIDLGLNVPLAQVHVGEFNGDGIADVLLVDVNASVWIAYGRPVESENETMKWDETGVYAPMLLESFAPELDLPAETYSAAAEQNSNQRLYHPDNFPTLFDTWIGYTGVEVETYDLGNIRKISGKPLIRATDSNTLNFSYSASGGKPLKIGSIVKNKMTISGETLQDGRVRLPLLDGMTVDTNTVKCSGCSADWSVGLGRNDFLIEAEKIGGVITWESQLTELPPLQVQVIDFTGDGKDDVSVAWVDDEIPTFVRFKSGGGGMPFPDAGATGTADAPVSPISGGMGRDSVPAFPQQNLDDFDARATADEVLEELKKLPEDGGLPAGWELSGVKTGISGLGCDDGCGLPIPSISFLVPGSNSLYAPPLVVPIPPLPDFPVMWVPPPPVSPLHYSSFFRLYVSPTTTGKVGLATCFGPWGLPLPPYIPGNCFVVVPKIEIAGFCPGQLLSDAASVAQAGLAVAAFSSGESAKNAGTFKPRRRTKPPNRQLKTPDIITQWIHAQLREISSMTVPAFVVKTPKLPKKSGEPTVDMNVFDRMSQSPFVNVVRKPVSIPYPEISTEEWKNYNFKVDEWLQNFRQWKEDTKQDIRTISSVKDEVEQVKGAVKEFSKKIDAAIDGVLQSYEKIETALKNLPQKKEDLPPSVQHPAQFLKDATNLENELKNKREKLQAYKKQTEKLKEMPAEEWEKFLSKLEGDLQQSLDSVEQVATAVKTNRDAIQSYIDQVKKLQKLPQEIEKLAERIVATTDIAGEYWSEWTDANKKAVQEWEQFFADVAKILELWNKIPKLFDDFNVKCNGCPMSRGALAPWVLNLALGAVKLPVIPMPQVPDIVLDLTGVSIGVSVTIPEITFEPVKFVPPELPNLPSLMKSFSPSLPTIPDVPVLPQMPDLSVIPTLPAVPSIPPLPALPTLPAVPMLPTLPSIPTLPILPEMPKIPLDLTVPNLVLPSLPVLISPPTFPNILAPIEKLLDVLKWLLDLFCLILGNWAPIAETKVASQIAELTNRTMLLPMDFALSGLSLNVPKPPLPPTETKLSNDFVPVLKTLNASVEQLANVFKMVMQQLKSASTGGTDKIFENVPGGESLGSVEWIPSEQIDVLAAAKQRVENSPDSGMVRQLERILVQKNLQPKNMPPEVVEALVQWAKKSNAAQSATAPSRTRRWLASLKTFIPSAQPSELPAGATVPSAEQTQQIQAVEPQIWYYSPKKDVAEVVTKFPVAGRGFGLTAADLDRDGNDELLYWIGNTLYFKRPVEVSDDFRPSGLITAGRYAGNASDDFEATGNTVHLTWNEWSKWYSPEAWRRTEVLPAGATIEFDPPRWNDVNYFEWTISERPDAVFEFAADSDDRISKQWKRIGFVVRPPVKKYEIRPMTTRVKRVVGHPVVYGSVLKELSRLQVPDCDDSEIEKPYFADKTVFVGVAPHSRLVVRTLPLEGQQKETREIDLRAGEETWVDFAEVCVTRGRVQAVAFGALKKMEVKEQLYQASEMRFELGQDDFVELELFDGTPLEIFGGETLELYVVDDLGEAIEHTTELEQKNQYALFHAREQLSRSFSRQKMLHDPQLSDDVTAPQLVVRPGTNVRAWIGEPVAIDASDTFDEQKLKNVWWDFSPEIDSDGDGDPANDHDFPQVGDDSYQPEQLLNVRLPAQKRATKYSVALNVEDPSGNCAQSLLDVSVESPQVELLDVSLRNGRAIGRIEIPRSGAEIGLWRMRDGELAALPERAQTDELGQFEFKTLGSGEGVELRDKFSKKVLAEVLPTGRPVVMSDEISVRVRAATEHHPTQLELRDSGDAVVATVTVQADAGDPVVVQKTPIESGVVSAVTVADRDGEDTVVWKKFEDRSGRAALVDTRRAKTFGILDAYGNFSVEAGSGLVLRLKKALLETDSLVFEIVKNGSRRVLVEFAVPSLKSIKVEGRKVLTNRVKKR